ncbi:HlyD family secretion protein [Corallococcus exiguus]|uniref:HlyD family secretion protein n=1 Tax=Corallococcus TaxID=83461 RepID=UPI000EDC9A24|nr:MULTISPECIES: HlyD family secretion protein [Corallococcus]NNB84188.1 HlyD family secretion protein [Corallococcus exiguus]NNB96013.1 HlyD family secretion protein [Corallococcus exiguus]NNC04483.1 HlyD family secretion protein [Corallococcus exiguus]NPC49947.1 HlyD family secretion protein [Corallococcus exiguus]RKH87078.1 HlyD family secretion protein [Corallococcus sp. AB032C]
MTTRTAPSLEAAPSTEAPAVAQPAKRSRAKQVLPILVGVAVLGGGARFLLTHGHESTDDAQVEGRIANVSPRVAGQVARVLVHDNQAVKAGDVVVELDHADLDARLEVARADVMSAEAQLSNAQAQLTLTEANAGANLRQARAGVTQASSGISSSKAALEQSRADVASSEARFKLAETDLGRVKQLREQGALSQSDLDTRQAAYDTAKAALDQSRARLTSTEAGIQSSSGGLEAAQGKLSAAETAPVQVQAGQAALKLAEARLKQTRAALTLSELAVSYAQVRAPVDGVVSRRTVEVGQMVGPERPLMAVVPQNDIWVVANFKEDQVGEMRAGQPVELKVDAFGGHAFKGHVDSLAGASGARFALLPPDNASGNFVKVVQRIPVLIRFDGDLKELPIKPGMSAYVTVDTGAKPEPQKSAALDTRKAE